MTEFDTISDELKRLGWTGKPGRGDHFKFSKPGKKDITLSRSLSSDGRAYKNTLAHIRQAEPDFSIGRQPHQLNRQETEQEDQTPPQCAAGTEHIRPGLPVRWTMPEQRDYSKLNNPDSVMNIRYKVISICDKDGNELQCITDDIKETATVTISDDTHTVTTEPRHLDNWELFSCSRCGKKYPTNLRTVDAKGNIEDFCAECRETEKKTLKQLDSLNDKLKELMPPMPKNGTAPTPFPGPFQFLYPYLTEETKTVLEPYRNTGLLHIPMDIISKVMTDFQNIIKKQEKKAETEIKRQKGIQQEQNIPSSLFAAWKDYISMIPAVIEHEFNGNKWQKANKQLKQQFARCTYTTERTQQGYTKILIKCPNPTAAYILTTTSELLYEELSNLSETYLVELECQPEKFHKTLPGDIRTSAQLTILTETTDKEKNGEWSLFPAPDEAERIIHLNRLLEELLEKNNVRNKPLMHLSFTYWNGQDTDSRFGKLSDLTDGEKQIRLTVCTDSTNQNRAREELKQLLPELKKEINSDKLQIILLTTDNDDKASILCRLFCHIPEEEFIEPPHRTEQPIRHVDIEALAASDALHRFEEMCKNVGIQKDPTALLIECISSATGCALEKAESLNQEKETTIKDTEMEDKGNTQETSPLDAVNSTSEDHELGQKTTRELLTELKRRGVQFNDISVPVTIRRTFSMEEI